MTRVSELIAGARQLDRLRKTKVPSERETRDLHRLLVQAYAGAAGYFFRNDFSEAAWLKPMHEAGIFEEFLGAAKDKPDESDVGRWLTARELADYLCRLAKVGDDGVLGQVVEVLKGVGTRDVYATGQFIRAVVKMPVKHAAALVPKLAEWCRTRNPFASEEEIAELAIKLAKAGYRDEGGQAMELLLRPAPEEEGGYVTGVFFGDDLREFVRGQFAEFAREFPEAALAPAERCLEAALPLRDEKRAKWHTATGARPPISDYSGWRAAIEDDVANGIPHFEDGLVEAVRDALGYLMEREPEKAEEVVKRYLGEGARFIFKRIALHTLAEYHEAYSELAKETATRKDLFDNSDLYHEYWRLVRAVFDELGEEQRRELEGWILAGGNRDDEEGKGWFILLRLKVLEKCDNLSQEAKSRLRELEAKLGQVDHPEFLVYTRTTAWAGSFAPGSPKSKDELEKMYKDRELVPYLQTWKPKKRRQPDDPSPEGLGRVLRELVTEEPEEWVGLAEDIDQTKPVYIWFFLDGLQSAWRAGKTFDWGPVLDLCDRVVPRDPPERWPDAHLRQRKRLWFDFDFTWSTVRHAVAMLLHDGLVEGREKSIGPEHFEKVRDILVRLVRDPDPTDRRERERLKAAEPEGKKSRSPDWLNVALNTNRGDAALALVRYAVRRANRIVRGELKGDRLEQAVKRALDGLVRDPCRSIRAVLGSNLDVLWWLDSEWAESKLGEILPTDGRRKNAWEAAWSSFLQYSRLNREMHEQLIEHYRRTIGLVANADEKDTMLEGLCKHLAALYVWEWDDPWSKKPSLVREFYEEAEDAAAAELASALGRFLRTERGEEEEKKRVREQWPRIKELLEWRIEGIAEKPGEHVREAQGYAAWFREIGELEMAGIGEMESVLRTLAQVRQTGYSLRPVVDYLEKYAKDGPGIAGPVLEGLVTNADRDAWLWEREKIEELVGVLFDSEDDEAKKAAVGVVERLWREGFWQAYEQHREQVAAVVGAAGL